jgi:hypothetical protein
MNKHRMKLIQRHIDRGFRSDGCLCPVALACGEFFDVVAHVTFDVISLDRGDNYATGERLANWIADFDSGREVKPITIEFDNGRMFAEIVL